MRLKSHKGGAPAGSAISRALKASVPLIPFLAASLSFSGCVSRSSYESDVDFLERKIVKERLAWEDAVQKLEQKVQDKGKTLNTITERYGALQKEHEALQKWRNGFKDNLEALARDIAELKLVISNNLPNMRGSVGSTMLIHLIDMENEIQGLLKVELPPPPPASTPLPEAPKGPQK